MNIELTSKEYRLLLDMVYIGNWILNSTRTDDRIEDYDLLQEKLPGQRDAFAGADVARPHFPLQGL